MFTFFNPFNLTLLNGIIPKVKTLDVNETTTEVIYGICPKIWRRLPCQGLLVLEVRQNSTTAAAAFSVFISTSGSLSSTANSNNIPVVNALGQPITGSQLTAGNRYFIYYNKCDNVFQLMNAYPTATA